MIHKFTLLIVLLALYASIINGKGMYDWAASQIPGTFGSGLGPETFARQACPGQSTVPPQCEFCVNETDWTSYNCTTSAGDARCGELEVFEVQAGQPTRLQVINAGALYAAQICIDGHNMTVVAADTSPVQPYQTDCIIAYPAERYDVMITPSAVAGDYWMRFTTAEQQIAADFSKNASLFGPDTPSFPHQAYAIVRVSESTGSIPLYNTDTSPPNCTGNITVNCGYNYWLDAVTLGCATGPSQQDPSRCKTTFELKAASVSYDDAAICGSAPLGGTIANANVEATVVMSFLPDQVPRYQGRNLNSRIEILPKASWGFPFRNPSNASLWPPRDPISFIEPPTPPLSLSNSSRELIYNKRTIFRPVDPTHPLGPSSPPGQQYPTNFSQGVMGPNALQVQYGDVVRLYLSCAEPYGPGCAMPHPMHLHGNKFAVLYVGHWNEPYNESKFNTENPVYRDTIVAHTDSFVVIQFVANNPGVWRFHCHVNIHHRSGMAMLVDVGGNSAVEGVRATPEQYNLCPYSGLMIENGGSSPSGSSSSNSSGQGSTASTSEVGVVSGHTAGAVLTALAIVCAVFG